MNEFQRKELVRQIQIRKDLAQKQLSKATRLEGRGQEICWSNYTHLLNEVEGMEKELNKEEL